MTIYDRAIQLREVIENLSSAFQSNNIGILDNEELIRELQHYAMEKTSKGSTYNGADGVNDDYVISLALCYDVCKNRKGISGLSLV